MWFLCEEVSSSSCCLGWAALFYCGTPWAFHIIILLMMALCISALNHKWTPAVVALGLYIPAFRSDSSFKTKSIVARSTDQTLCPEHCGRSPNADTMPKSIP